jgi:YgiT-type zinc finger domain-containing protein
MRCEVCGAGERRDKLIRYSLALGDRFIVVEHVPAGVCDHCGETTLDPAVVERLQETVWESRRPVRLIETPVYEFA